MSFKWGISIIFIHGKVLDSDCHISDGCVHFSYYPLYIVIDQCNMASISGKSMNQFSLVNWPTIVLLFLHPGYAILYNLILKFLTIGGRKLKFPLEVFNIQGYFPRWSLIFKEWCFHLWFSSEDSAFNRCSPMQNCTYFINNIVLNNNDSRHKSNYEGRIWWMWEMIFFLWVFIPLLLQ